MLGREPTAATQAVPSARPVRRLEPQPPRSRPVPSRGGLEAGHSPPRAPAARRRNPLRAFTALLALLILAGTLAVAYVASREGSEPVRTREIGGDDVGQVVEQLDRLIEENTR